MIGLNVPRTFKDRPGDDPTRSSFAEATIRLMRQPFVDTHVSIIY